MRARDLTRKSVPTETTFPHDYQSITELHRVHRAKILKIKIRKNMFNTPHHTGQQTTHLHIERRHEAHDEHSKKHRLVHDKFRVNLQMDSDTSSSMD